MGGCYPCPRLRNINEGMKQCSLGKKRSQRTKGETEAQGVPQKSKTDGHATLERGRASGVQVCIRQAGPVFLGSVLVGREVAHSISLPWPRPLGKRRA